MVAQDLTTQICRGQFHEGMTFNQRVWAMAARVPQGKVCTYADLAHALGSRGYRAVGNALNRNPLAPRVPCHRVVGSDGSLTGFAAGIAAKRRLLESEGIPLDAAGRVRLNEKVRFSFQSSGQGAARKELFASHV